MSKRSSVRSVVWAAITMSILLAGCYGGDHGERGSRSEEVAHDAAAGSADTPAVLHLGPQAEAILARADVADGTEDHVVSKCPGCQSAMDGSPDHAAQVGDYELHFCSDACSKRFQEDTEASILALSVEP